jgi:5-methylcytosine-specific restriction enzyme A
MPQAAPHPCNHPGCPAVVFGAYCAAHDRARQQAQDKQRGSSHARGYGARWRKLRDLVLHEEPICRVCKRKASTDVDHIVPKSRGGTDARANLQGLCKPCHSTKTAKEDGGWGRGG